MCGMRNRVLGDYSMFWLALPTCFLALSAGISKASAEGKVDAENSPLASRLFAAEDDSFDESALNLGRLPDVFAGGLYPT